jgi:hypothetical protein
MRLSGSMCLLTILGMWACTAPALAFEDAKYPELSGIWGPIFARGGNTQTPFDPTKLWGKAQEAPLTPEYQAIHEASLAAQENGGQGNWISGARCIPAPMPTSMNVYGEMEIVILPEITHILLNHNSEIHRRIYTDGRDWPKEVEPSFQGYSIGRWIDSDGTGRFDVLEVETRHFKGQRALDPSGLPTHSDNQSIIKERIYADKSDANVMHDDITLFDHAFTRPWTVNKTYRRGNNRRQQHADQECSAMTANMLIGSELYYLSADRDLMPTRKDQPPPDFRYFKQPTK